MKTKLLTLFSLLALLLVSTSILADGRPTGIRIGRAANGGDNNVEIDVTITGTDTPWNTFSSTVRLGNRWSQYGPTVWAYASSNFNSALPYAIDWGDGSRQRFATLFGSPGTGWAATFSHTYSPGSYVITVGDSRNGYIGFSSIYTGNIVTGLTRYVHCQGDCKDTGYQSWFTTTWEPYTFILAITANTTVSTGTGIPTLNIYGLLAMSFVLVGTGVLLFRRPQQA